MPPEFVLAVLDACKAISEDAGGAIVLNAAEDPDVDKFHPCQPAGKRVEVDTKLPKFCE